MVKIVGVIACTCIAFLSAPGSVMAQANTSNEIVERIPFVTLRDETGKTNAAEFYGDNRSTLKAGWCGLREVNIPALEAITETVQTFRPDEFLRLREIQKASPDAVLESLAGSGAGHPPTLYTHGFNISFEKGCRRAAVLKDNANIGDRFLFFSWPSDGSLFNYTRDETDLYWSVTDLADLFHDMSKRYAPERINILGHSLGGRGVALALYDLAGRHPEVRLNDVVLLAPDIDFENFVKLLPRIRPIVRSLTIYVSDDDRPLDASQQLHGYLRLGQTGNDVSKLQGVEVIDVSDASSGSVSGHLYHIFSDEVGADLDQLLNDGKRAREREYLIPVGQNLWRLMDRD